MKISRFTKIASVLAIVTLIVGFSACDQSQQLLFPGPPETGLPDTIRIGVSLPLDDENGPLYGLTDETGL